MQSNYLVWDPDLGQTAEDGKDMGGGNARDAATGWAEWNDCHSAEYAIASRAERHVCVLDKVTGRVSEFTVTGWSMPCYSAKPA